MSEEIDWEVELGVVIGTARRQHHGGRTRSSHVFGYTVINDVTARDIQSDWGGQYFKGKSLDGSCPRGPWVVTPDEVDDPQALNLRLTRQRELKQDGNTCEMIYPVDSIIEWVSMGMTLLPGMMIATGTPDGVGFARTPPEFLQVGDVVEAEVEGIGMLRNKVVAAPGHSRTARPVIHLDAARLAVVAAAALVAGAVNAIAGGGTLLSFPALLLLGFPALTANVTNTVGLLPGYAGGSIAYRAELSVQRERVRFLGPISVVGAVAGAILLTRTSNAVFAAVVPSASSSCPVRSCWCNRW